MLLSLYMIKRKESRGGTRPLKTKRNHKEKQRDKLDGDVLEVCICRVLSVLSLK